MGRHIQNGTGIVISVADEKDERYVSGWKPYTGDAAGDQPKTRSSRAKQSE